MLYVAIMIFRGRVRWEKNVINRPSVDLRRWGGRGLGGGLIGGGGGP